MIHLLFFEWIPYIFIVIQEINSRKEFAMKKHILAVGAHADDIEMSMAGSILKYMDLGYTVTYVMTTNNMAGAYAYIDKDGKVASYLPQPEEEIKIRKREAQAAAEKFFNTTPIHLDFPQKHYTGPDDKPVYVNYGSASLDFIPAGTPSIIAAHEIPEAVERLTDIILDCDPEVIITRGLDDYNVEHYSTCLYTIKARAMAMQKGYDGTILFCNLNTYLPKYYCRFDTFIDTTGYMEKKIAATGCHTSQKPRPELLDWQDWNHGAQCGCETAEVFGIEFGTWKTGIMTAELLKNHLYCRENYSRIFF